MARPILRLGFGDNDNVLYAPAMVHDAFANLVIGNHTGAFDTEYFSGKEMKVWIGAINNRQGHEFNERVAEEFRKLHFRARASVHMSEFNVPQAAGDLGEVDVLGWNDSGLVYVVGCKNLRFAMTVGEIADQLRRFRGEANDDLARHLKRCRWLSENVEQLARVVGHDRSPRVKPLLVTNTTVPMQFSSDLPIPAEDVVPIRGLPDRVRR